LTIPGDLLTTAMAVMPHTDVERALEVALSLDVPFWPQLPNYSYYEDMYVQAAEHFPGILLDVENRTLRFSLEKFVDELEQSMAHFDEPQYFDVSATYSVVYHRFLSLNLSDRPAIRGQLEGPISFGFNILDQDERPILFDDTVRPFMLEFLARRINVQLERLKTLNENAFMFVDEPGLQFLFSAYASSIKRFIEKGGVLVWGIVPTGTEFFEKEGNDSLIARMESVWQTLGKKGIDIEYLLTKSQLSPATCCLVNPDKEKTVEKAFESINRLSDVLKERYHLG
jgi:hypothetical protein